MATEVGVEIVAGVSTVAAAIAAAITKNIVERKSALGAQHLQAVKDERDALASQCSASEEENSNLTFALRLAVEQEMDGWKLSHNLSHRIRDIETVVSETDFRDDVERTNCAGKVHSSLGHVLLELVTYFEKYVTKQPTAACIKIFGDPPEIRAFDSANTNEPQQAQNSDQPPLVLCLVRDPVSQARRTSEEAAYPLTSSTAFLEIFEKDLKFFSVNDDLETEFRNGKYRNPTPDFWTRYRSVLVIPIRARARDSRRPTASDHEIVGFLALDTPDAGAFRPRHDGELAAGFHVAAAAADQLYWPLKHLMKRTYAREPRLYRPLTGDSHVNR